MAFESPVNAPGALSYGPPAVDFSSFATIVDAFNRAGLEQQQKQRNAQLLQQGQQQLELSKAFQNGLPLDANGNPDYTKILGTFAKFGAVDKIWQLAPLLAQQQQSKIGLYGDDGTGAPPAPQPSPGAGAPSSVPARLLPAPDKSYPAGDAGTNTVASLVTDKFGETQQAGAAIGTISRQVGVEPNAQLTPGQAKRVQVLLDRAAAVTPSPQAATPQQRIETTFADASGGGSLPPSTSAGAPAPPPAQVQPQQRAPAPLVPTQVPQPQQAAPSAPPPQGGGAQPQAPQQFGLPPTNPFNGQPITSPQAAQNVLRAIDIAADRLMRTGDPTAMARAKALLAHRAEIVKPFTPIEARPGATFVNPQNMQPVLTVPGGNAQNVALQRFLDANPDATPEQIQAFVQSGRGGRSAISMYMNRYLQEHPDATADEVKRAAQLYTTQITAQNRFLSGPQGNTIRSLNVVVSHIQTMQDLGDALKNGNIIAFNRLAQSFAEQTGEAAPTNFDTAKQIVGAEIIKALGVAGAGTQTERQEAADAFNRARSPAQLSGAIGAARKLLIGQLSGLRRQYVAATGLPAETFDQMLEPETRAFFGTEEKSRASDTKPDTDGWTTLPNGARIREIK